MMRAAPLVVGALAGAIVGAAATYLSLRPGPEAAAGYAAAVDGPAASAAPPPAASRADAEPGPLPTSDRFAVYAFAAESAQPDELEFGIQRAAALPPSHRRAFELDALLMRLAEIDVARAVRFARTLRLETERLVPLFQLWAERDADAALAELERVDNPAAMREILLSLLDVLGDDERAVERVSAVLSPAQMASFRLDAAVRLAKTDPFRAIRRALALTDSSTRAAALSRIAAEWARQDPAAAFAQVDMLEDDSLRRAYQSAVLNEWARVDPDGVFALIRTGTVIGDPALLGSVLMSLASADPQAVLELAERMPIGTRAMAQMTAFRVLAERDLNAALAMLDALPRNRDRDQILSAVGQVFAQQDPDGALEWVRSLRPPSMNAVLSVVNGLASVDSERAVDLLLDGTLDGLGGLGARAPLGLMLTMNMVNGPADSARMGAIADRLVERADVAAAGQIGALMSGWARRDAEAAVEWLIANADRAGRQAVTQVASQLAAEDPVAAAGMMSRLPPEMHDDWLQSVAAGYAQYDPDAAAAWIAQYEGRPGFAAALASIAPALAQTDPQAAARMLDRVDGPAATLAATQVAAIWAASEPAAAAEWALQLGDAALRSNAVGSVVASWASQDPDGAEQWVLGLPRGGMRDQALQRLVPVAAARTGEVDRRMLDAFSSDAMRQGAVMSSAMQLANRDREAARRLVDEHIADPEARQQVYETIERSRGAAVAVPVPGIFLR